MLFKSHVTLTPTSSFTESRELANIEDSVNASIQGLEDDIKRQITAIRNNTNNIMINRTTLTRKQIWEQKQPHGYFKQQTDDISHEQSRKWLRKRNFKRKTEPFLIAGQNNVIQTNYVNAKIDKMQQKSVGYMEIETKRLISECSKQW